VWLCTLEPWSSGLYSGLVDDHEVCCNAVYHTQDPDMCGIVAKLNLSTVQIELVDHRRQEGSYYKIGFTERQSPGVFI
jgi:hypothetical protein